MSWPQTLKKCIARSRLIQQTGAYILWRYYKNAEAITYELNTVTYGLSCAPFLALCTVKQLADDEAARFPEGSATLRQDIYMDDILTGASSIEDARDLRRQFTTLCSAGGFPLRKWSTNHPDLLADVPPEHRMQRDALSWQPHESHSTLGLHWHPSLDCFSFSTQSIAIASYTKRSVLSLTAHLFDPLGWLAPAIVQAKILFQSTWLQGLDWDTPLDDTSTAAWRSFQAGLNQLEKIRVPQYISLQLADTSVELHGFADASERAYAAVLYIRTLEPKGKPEIKLISAKTKVAPLKQITLPRLELCASTLLVRLTAHIRTILGAQKVPIHLWSDSTVALGWIRGHPSKWKTFVANRVSEIQTTLPEVQWHHLPGEENPADSASRGISPGALVNHTLWWQGPSWLQSDITWPAMPATISMDVLPEERVRTHVTARRPQSNDELEELTRFSSLSRLLRVTAWMRRWLLRRGAAQREMTLSDGSRSVISLTASECEEARTVWIRITQSRHYTEELKILAKGTQLPNKNLLTPLTPFLDFQGILRVGGRIKHTLLAYDEKHPAILPRASHFTQLVVETNHRRTLHGGVQLTLGAIRQQYWIPQGRTLVKAAIRQCVTCVRWAETQQQLMSHLPPPCVTPSRPFLHTGVDYAGPIQLRTSKGRGHHAHKAFLAVFICLSIKAVHLEVVSDYTAEAFLAALRRFTSRRGRRLCRYMYSDCGTNFVGADAQLRSFFSASNSEQRRIADQLANDQIQWRFNPPSAPHFGGLWEAAAKSFKHHLRRVLGETTLTYEEMSTLLAQIEACLNSRPLQALTDDPHDLTALTPGHFLIGTALNAVPEPSLLDAPTNRLSRWQLLPRMRDHFWDRWSREYLHSLLQRPKWWASNEQIQVGRLCLLRNEATPPTRWPLARITRVHPGEDGRIRVVIARTASSELVRPLAKIILLPSIVSDTQEERLEQL